jgi:hypothetical protein
MNFIKINYKSPERDDVFSTLYLPFSDIKSVTHDIGVAKQEDGSELKIERLTLTLNNMVNVRVPKLLGDGKTQAVDRAKNPIFENQERNEMYFVEGEESVNVLNQLQ